MRFFFFLFSFKPTFLLLLRDEAINLVGLRDVQLRPFGDLLKVWTFVEGTAKSGLPGGRFSLVPLLEFTFKHSPGLKGGEEGDEVKRVNGWNKQTNKQI